MASSALPSNQRNGVIFCISKMPPLLIMSDHELYGIKRDERIRSISDNAAKFSVFPHPLVFTGLDRWQSERLWRLWAPASGGSPRMTREEERGARLLEGQLRAAMGS